jgi:hypothetical protein
VPERRQVFAARHVVLQLQPELRPFARQALQPLQVEPELAPLFLLFVLPAALEARKRQRIVQSKGKVLQ